MNRRSNNNPWQGLIGLFLLFMAFGAFGENFIGGMIFLILGATLLSRGAAWFQVGQWFSSSSSTPNSESRRRARRMVDNYDDGYGEAAFHSGETSSGAERVYAHALKAVERAGLNPDQVQVLPVDIGAMVYFGSDEPAIFRTRSVPDDADYVQPFVQLRLPTKAMGRIKFEIIDSDGQILYVHEEIHQLERGRNLVVPSTRLPIHDAQAMSGDWQMRVSADGVTLATHRFTWQESDARRIRRHVSEDGELSSELRAALAESRLQEMSLDELLSFQDDAEEPKRQSKT